MDEGQSSSQNLLYLSCRSHGVSVGSGVSVGCGVVGRGVIVSVGCGVVGRGVIVSVGCGVVAVGVGVGDAVSVGVGVAVSVAVGVAVAVAVSVGVAVSVAVTVGVIVEVGDAVAATSERPPSETVQSRSIFFRTIICPFASIARSCSIFTIPTRYWYKKLLFSPGLKIPS